MKKILVLILLLNFNTSFSQVPDWIKNALPVAENHLKKIEKKGDKYIEKFKSYPENSNEKKIYYRVKYINYLKRMESIGDEISKVQDSTKPFPFPIFVSPSNYANLVSFDSEKNRTSIKSDTIFNVVDLVEKYSTKFTPIISDNDFFDIVIADKANNKFILENAYSKDELTDYPHFNSWKAKYFLFNLSEHNKLKRIERIKQDSLSSIKKNQLEKENTESRSNEVSCFTRVDDFTGEKIVQTGQKRLITIELESVKNQAQDLWNKGIYIDYETFVLATSAIKIGKIKLLDVYIKFRTDKPIQYYGIITKGAFIEFKLENNKVIKLPFTKTVTPTTEYKYKYSYYENSLLLNESSITELRKSNVKKIRIHFSKGYQDYDVTENYDLISKQVECLK